MTQVVKRIGGRFTLQEALGGTGLASMHRGLEVANGSEVAIKVLRSYFVQEPVLVHSYFEELKRVGIFHESPQLAASYVASIWDDIDGWWGSPEVRNVLERFKHRYCRLPADLLGRIEHALREVIVSKKAVTH